jgi:hypothetical protein
MRLLVVDWDYFWPDLGGSGHSDWPLYDWGHSETPFGIHGAWDFRAQSFFRAGRELPMTTGEEKTFWSRFKFSPSAKLYVAESNARAVTPEVAEGVRELWLYDAHHDSGYKIRTTPRNKNLKYKNYSVQQLNALVTAGRWHCDDWMIFYYSVGTELHVRYPEWKEWALNVEPYAGIPQNFLDRDFDDPEEETPVFDRVFLCRSGAWTPPWVDPAFRQFISDCPVEPRTCLEGPDWSSVRRFDVEACRASAEVMKAMGSVSATAAQELVDSLADPGSVLSRLVDGEPL